MSTWEFLDRFALFGILVEVGETVRADTDEVDVVLVIFLVDVGEIVCVDTDEVDVVLVTFPVDVGEIVCVDTDDVDVDMIISEHGFDGS